MKPRAKNKPGKAARPQPSAPAAKSKPTATAAKSAGSMPKSAAASPKSAAASPKSAAALPKAARPVGESSPEKTGRAGVVMPLIPASTEIHPILSALIACAAFLDLSDEETVSSEAAGKVLEQVGAYMH